MGEDTRQSSPLINGVLPATEASDMNLVIRIRSIIVENAVEIARLILEELPFWYHTRIDETGQVFWTENHVIMSTSSQILLHELISAPIPSVVSTRLNTFIDLKLKLGMAEWLSPVYYPFTIVSLLNLYDYTKQPSLKDKCQTLLDKMSKQVLSVCLQDGSIISPSGRSYARHRMATQGHHISLFIKYLLTRRNIPQDTGPESALKEAVSSTTYMPSESVYDNIKTQCLDIDLPLSPTWRELYDFLEERRDTMSLEDRMSTLWSYGAYGHPQALLEIVPFMDKCNLWRHPHFRAAAPFRRGLVLCCPLCPTGRILYCLSHSFLIRPFALGALLTGARVRVHREGCIMLASLANGFNAGLPAFQQWPWTINMAGLPIWCAFGPVGHTSNRLLNQLGNQHATTELSAARVMPLVIQHGNTLHATYLSRGWLLWLWNRGYRPRVRWPTAEMDESGTMQVEVKKVKWADVTIESEVEERLLKLWRQQNQTHVWQWGRKGSAAVAWTVRGLEVQIVVRDLEVANLSVPEFLAEVRQRCESTRKGSRLRGNTDWGKRESVSPRVTMDGQAISPVVGESQAGVLQNGTRGSTQEALGRPEDIKAALDAAEYVTKRPTTRSGPVAAIRPGPAAKLKHL